MGEVIIKTSLDPFEILSHAWERKFGVPRAFPVRFPIRRERGMGNYGEFGDGEWGMGNSPGIPGESATNG